VQLRHTARGFGVGVLLALAGAAGLLTARLSGGGGIG
jgi:hypothetical protein